MHKIYPSILKKYFDMPVGAAIFILFQLYDPQFSFFVHAQPTFYGCRKQTLHIIHGSACINPDTLICDKISVQKPKLI
ncbi:hypothetical protein D3C86_2046030 [compost metagenome]